MFGVTRLTGAPLVVFDIRALQPSPTTYTRKRSTKPLPHRHCLPLTKLQRTLPRFPMYPVPKLAGN